MIPLAVAAIAAAAWGWHRDLIADRCAQREQARHATERHDHHTTTYDEADLAHRANGLHARIWTGTRR